MFLTYGITEHGELVSVGEVPRGETYLKCPYCGDTLVAKKGDFKAHHLAHKNKTCREVERGEEVISLPFYDRFDIKLPGKYLEVLKAMRATPGDYELRYLKQYDQLEKWGFIGWVPVPHTSYARTIRILSAKAKIIFGDLPLAEFIPLQTNFIETRHEEISEDAKLAYQPGHAEFWTRLTDLRIFRAQWKRVLTSSLYLLHIKTEASPYLYKIGVTQRPVEERVAEIARELGKYLSFSSIEIVEVFPSQASIEFYFKHRYTHKKAEIGPLTEYFQFLDDLEANDILQELRSIGERQFTPREREVAEGEASLLERYVQAREARMRGIQQAKQQGKHLGRPVGSGATPEEFLQTPEAQRVLSVTEREGQLSVRVTAKKANVSPSTVQKVRKALAEVAAATTEDTQPEAPSSQQKRWVDYSISELAQMGFDELPPAPRWEELNFWQQEAMLAAHGKSKVKLKEIFFTEGEAVKLFYCAPSLIGQAKHGSSHDYWTLTEYGKQMVKGYLDSLDTNVWIKRQADRWLHGYKP